MQVKRQTGEDAQGRSDGQDQQRRDFSPLTAEAPSPEQTEASRGETFERFHEVLSELADS